ncbi:MAG: lipid A biosynthesis acyltransferase, partial [Gammaproteobacteria bacterium]|nr:lipid A biosynthesis acyltransferase [Gammaproteobacteria bacterium]
PAVATLQQRTGANILPVFSVPSSRGYRVVIDAPLEIPDVAESEAMEAITAAATARIEAQIRARPEAWLWMHDRWRERP